ncbi:LuxR C-terminal-related transcriptional regulator [Rhodococcus sp. APC 3903]|uniref:LuxR C-terminal-related transcriptional regulator n=1 Tax=Rhodococcus sp. APC 3903 TaxID=3035193 RepID=UPI0025B58081|nr:LuxR C-terminal-related transcriptional regulator [Rhodococcus sp. APC 3903]
MRKPTRSAVDGRLIVGGLREAPSALGSPTDSNMPIGTAAGQAWADLAAALDAEVHDLSPELLAALAHLRTVDQQIMRRLGFDSSTRQLAGVIGILESLPCITNDLIAAAPRLVCELGFDRAIISRIEDGLWISEAVFVPESEEWAAEINRAGQETPQKLGTGILETEIVRRRDGLLVTDVQTESRVNRPIAVASQSRSYVAAPIISGGRVVGLLHADKYRQSADVDSDDCQLLIGFAQSLRLALSRARLAEEVNGAKSRLDAISSMLGFRTDTVHEVSVRRSTESSYFDSGTGHPKPQPYRTAPPNSVPLTRREHEVLALMAKGSTNSAIARELVIAEGTVKQHVKHVLRKLQVSNRSEAVAVWFSEFVRE